MRGVGQTACRRDSEARESPCEDGEGIGEYTEDIVDLRAEMKELVKLNFNFKTENETSQRVNEIEQHQRANNLEIKGVPGGNDIMTVMESIGVAVGESISENDIGKTGVKNIVRFCNE